MEPSPTQPRVCPDGAAHRSPYGRVMTVTGPTQIQLDDFGRRLQALESELELLRAQAAASRPAPALPAPPRAIPAPTPVPAPAAPSAPRSLAWQLTYAKRLIEQGRVKAALKELERERARAFAARR